jgi:transposase
MGKSGRDMISALVAGTTDPVVLADLARGLLRKKIPALREALEGRFAAEHSLIVSQILAHIDFLDEAIARLSAEIEQQIEPFARQRQLLMSIPGVRQRTAEVLIAELGVDMTVFSDTQAPRVLGEDDPRQRRVGRQTPLRQDRQGQQMAQNHPHRSRSVGRQDQALLPRRAIPTPARPGAGTTRPSPRSGTRS